MKTCKQTLDVITQKFTAYLKKIKRRPSTIEKYTEVWHRVKVFMQSRGIEFYDKKVGERYLKYLYGRYTYSTLTKYRKDIVNYVEGLAEFWETGTIAMGPKKIPERTFPGVIGTTMESYIAYKKEIHQVCKSTLHNYRLYLHGLYMFFKTHSIQSISQICPKVILIYVNSSHDKTIATRHIEVLVIKGYLKYLYDQQMISSD
jgi:integrase/recombinase XerD